MISGSGCALAVGTMISRMACVGACRLRARDTEGMSAVSRRMLLTTPTVDTVRWPACRRQRRVSVMAVRAAMTPS